MSTGIGDIVHGPHRRERLEFLLRLQALGRGGVTAGGSIMGPLKEDPAYQPAMEGARQKKECKKYNLQAYCCIALLLSPCGSPER